MPTSILIRRDISFASIGQIYKATDPIYKDQKILYIPIKDISMITEKSFDFIHDKVMNSASYYVFNYVRTMTGEKAFKIADIDNKFQFTELIGRDKPPIGFLFSKMILMDFDIIDMLLKVSPILDLSKMQDSNERVMHAPIKSMTLGDYDNDDTI